MSRSGKQVTVLRKILEEKSILFGAFSPVITKQLKKEKWTEVRDLAVACGLVTNEKDYAYIRDTVWPNLRKSTVVSILYWYLKIYF